MIGRVVEIAEGGRFLSAERGFMTVSAEGKELGRVPLGDIAVLLVYAHGLTYTNNLARELSQRAAAMVLCGPNHTPFAWLWPLVGHNSQAARMRAQIEAGKPLCKRLWLALVQARIEQQGAALAALGRPAGGFRLLAREVRSGDPGNLEAQAARRYWPLVFGPDFRRDRGQPGINGLLNCGYTVLRSATARAVVSAGLHPLIGIHHRNRTDDMVPVDDLMEPFRPIVDIVVARLVAQGRAEITPDAKRELAAVISFDLGTQAGTTPLSGCLERLERLESSLGQAFETGEAALDLPLSPLPLEVPALD